MFSKDCVFIFSTSQSVNISRLIAEYFISNYDVFFIVPEKDLPDFNKSIGDLCKVINENIIFKRNEFERILIQSSISPEKKQLIRNRFGWYYQQFLKLFLVFLCNANKFIIWDGDTIPLNEIKFHDNFFQNIFISPYEYNENYFKTNKNLLAENFKDVKYSQIVQFCFLTYENVLLIKKILQIDKFDGSDSKKNFIEKVIQSLNSSNSISLFSEYELIGNIKLNSEKKIRKMPILFYRDSISIYSPFKVMLLKYMNFKMVTFEENEAKQNYLNIKFIYHIIKFYVQYFICLYINRY